MAIWPNLDLFNPCITRVVFSWLRLSPACNPGSFFSHFVNFSLLSFLFGLSFPHFFPSSHLKYALSFFCCFALFSCVHACQLSGPHCDILILCFQGMSTVYLALPSILSEILYPILSFTTWHIMAPPQRPSARPSAARPRCRHRRAGGPTSRAAAAAVAVSGGVGHGDVPRQRYGEQNAHKRARKRMEHVEASYFFVFVLFFPLWLLWLYHALPIYLSIYLSLSLSLYLYNLTESNLI